MHILMLSPIVPWPLNMGSKIRIFHVLKELSRVHKITMVALAQEGEQDVSETLLSICAYIHVLPLPRRSRWFTAFLSLCLLKPYRVAKFYQASFKKKILELCYSENYDMIWIHFLNMCAYVPTEILKTRTIILDQHNSDELWWLRFVKSGPWWQRAFAKQNLWKERIFQKKALEFVDAILCASTEEAAFMRTRATPSCRVWTAPNGIEYNNSSIFSPSNKGEMKGNIILFCGCLNLTMNIDAIERFIILIFPHIKKAIPNAEFWVIGHNPANRVVRLDDHDGVKIIGTVPDVRPYYKRARVAVAPFQYGAGTKLKVLEAMALGVPLITTRIGAHGIIATSGKHMMIEDDNIKFAQSVIRVLQDDSLHHALAIEAKQLVKKKYSWEKIMQEILFKVDDLNSNKLSNLETI